MTDQPIQDVESDDFGVVIACAKHDYALAKGGCASIRHFMPGVPICLITDGDFASDELTRAYGVKILPRSAVKNSWLRENSYGWGITKMIAFWESPFKRFLFLDADALVYGDLRTKLALNEPWDFVTPNESTYGSKPDQLNPQGHWIPAAGDEPYAKGRREGIDQYFFDTARIQMLYPDFPWARFHRRYFCTGTFAARRGVIPLEDYQRVMKQNADERGIFKYGEMGLLNFLIFHGIFEQRYRAYTVPFQTETTRVEWQEVAQRFPSPLAPTSPDNSWVLHYTNPKPLTHHTRYSAAMTHFRKQALRDTEQKTGLAAKIALLKEDMRVHGRLLYAKNRLGLAPTRPVG